MTVMSVQSQDRNQGHDHDEIGQTAGAAYVHFTTSYFLPLFVLNTAAKVDICQTISFVTSLLMLEVMSFGGLKPCSYSIILQL